MTITALPTPPSRSDPGSFAARGDSFLGALPALATEINAAITSINASVSTATTQAGLATTNGAAQVSLAAAQAGLATTNGAAQVTLATTQAGLAAGSATSAADMAALATASANYKGNWSALTGALSIPASVSHNGSFWALNTNTANVTTVTPGVSGVWTQIKFGPNNLVLTYDNRANLRSATPVAGDFGVVEGLGLFVYYAGNTETDDDETCFATASGRWLLSAADPDFVYAAVDTVLFDVSAVESRTTELEDAYLKGSFVMSLTSLAAVTSTDFNYISIPGARVGDSVVVNPGGHFGNGNGDSARLSYTAYVSAQNTVTVSIRNASAASATLSASTWAVLVIKK